MRPNAPMRGCVWLLGGLLAGVGNAAGIGPRVGVELRAGVGPRVGDAPRVEVFTDQDYPVTRLDALPQATVYLIDGLKRAQTQLSADLPADEDAARALASERLEAQPQLHDEIRSAAEGLAQAHLRYGLDRYPAIVFDGRAVIYGITDLAQARALFEQAQAR